MISVRFRGLCSWHLLFLFREGRPLQNVQSLTSLNLIEIPIVRVMTPVRESAWRGYCMLSPFLDIATVSASSSDAVAGCISRLSTTITSAVKKRRNGYTVLQKLTTSVGTHNRLGSILVSVVCALRLDAGPHIGPPVPSCTEHIENTYALLQRKYPCSQSCYGSGRCLVAYRSANGHQRVYMPQY
jgi:hypothetical protein